MGTNFYCRRIPTQDQLNEIAGLVCNHQIDDAIDKLHEVNKQIHICKRSSGWQIGFDHNNGEYWQPTRESVNAFISQSDIIVFDEYKKEYTTEEFWDAIDEHNRDPNNNWDSTKDIEEQINDNCSCVICWPDIRKVKEMFSIRTNVNDFYNGGLRWNVFTDFC
jgi:hypothetical protein